MVVLRAYAALTGKRDQGETVEAFTYLNATHPRLQGLVGLAEELRAIFGAAAPQLVGRARVSGGESGER